MGIVSRFLTAVKEAASLGLGGEGLPRPARLVYVLLTALGTILVTAGVLVLRKYFGAEGILILGIISVAVFWGWVLRWLYTDGRITFSHVLVIWLMASGTVMGGPATTWPSGALPTPWRPWPTMLWWKRWPAAPDIWPRVPWRTSWAAKIRRVRTCEPAPPLPTGQDTLSIQTIYTFVTSCAGFVNNLCVT